MEEKEIQAQETVNEQPQSEVKYEHYDQAAIVIHCNKCNAFTTLCTKDEEGKIAPLVITEGVVDMTKLIGGPMPTDNHSAFPLFCDTCKTMLTLRFMPVTENKLELAVEDVIEDAQVVEEVVEPKLEIVK